MVKFHFVIWDVKKVDTGNSLITLVMGLSIVWEDNRLSCRDKEVQTWPGFTKLRIFPTGHLLCHK